MRLLIITIALITVCNAEVPSCKGCVSLDEHSFQKVLPKFKATLIKFDVAYPYGDKHDVFVKFSDELISNKDILLGEVNIKSYGDKENEAFATGLGVNTTDLPSIQLYLGNSDKQFTFEKDEFNLENLRRFVKKNSGVYWLLPGCLKDFDQLAMRVVDGGDAERVLKDAESKLQLLSESDKVAAKAYIAYIKKVAENGKGFIKNEEVRLGKLLADAKISEKKKEEILIRVNILYSFKSAVKDEL